MLAVGLALQIVKRLRGPQGSLNDLQYRGLVSDERGMVSNDPSYDKAMKNVRTMKIEELTKEQILAARKRRSREREGDSMDLSKVELPSNHPFAVAEQVTEEEEELQRARLNVRRGPPLQDLSGTRGFPEDRPPQAPSHRARPA
ncbi:hypothetical protein WJX81_002171 [Elliptochloris bilobata]|uniref:Uncharacterized protein n=1 Tax=Elliptochloris bilobata TaxID=381761 RepID=A0AAW1RPM5_9CHLO